MGLIRKIRSKKMPSCLKCKHFDERVMGVIYCSCPDYLHFIEKTECVCYANEKAALIRGTKFCKFESKEQQ